MSGTLLGALDDERLDLLSMLQDREAITGDWPPPELIGWLGRLTLLYGVPFQYLVPDAKLLPRESLRLFFVDPPWVHALLDGALSIGRPEAARVLLRQAFDGNFTRNLVREARAIRDQERARFGAAPPDPATGDGEGDEAPAGAAFELSGFLLRSGIVAGYRGLEIAAFRDPGGRAAAGNLRLAPLRLERLATDVLMGLFAARPGSIEITPPPEGMHFTAPPGMREAGDGRLDLDAWRAGRDGESARSADLADALMAKLTRFTLDIEGR